MKKLLRHIAKEIWWPILAVALVLAVFFLGVNAGVTEERERIDAEISQDTLLHYSIIVDKVQIADTINPTQETAASSYSFFIMSNGDIVKTNIYDYNACYVGDGFVYPEDMIYGHR